MRRLAALAGSLLLGAWLVLGVGVAVPLPAFGCSCVGPQPLEAYATPDNVILAGRVIANDGQGVQVAVERWFAGAGAAPVVRIGGDFGNGASCGVGARPAIGSRWVWVAWRPQDADGPPIVDLPDNGDLQISICQPTGDLATPEGQALLDEATATFGGAPAPAATAGPAATAEPGAPGAAAGPGTDTLVLVAGGGVVAVGLLILAGAALVARGRRRA